MGGSRVHRGMAEGYLVLLAMIGQNKRANRSYSGSGVETQPAESSLSPTGRAATPEASCRGWLQVSVLMRTDTYRLCNFSWVPIVVCTSVRPNGVQRAVTRRASCRRSWALRPGSNAFDKGSLRFNPNEPGEAPAPLLELGMTGIGTPVLPRGRLGYNTDFSNLFRKAI